MASMMLFCASTISAILGSAYLDGRLVSDNFANGSPWEIGLKQFMIPGMERELVVRIAPLQQHAAVLRYFPGKMIPRAANDGTIPIEVYSIAAIPEYHAMLALNGEAS
jgi:beta-galactosidase